VATTIKVSEPTRDRIKAIGAQTRQTAEDVVSQALDEYERALFWRAYRAAAQAGPTEDALAETQVWEATLRDGLTDA
jgi:predicted transcriptional regulator